MSPTLLDVVVIIGSLVEGEELLTLFSLSAGDLGSQFSMSNASY